MDEPSHLRGTLNHKGRMIEFYYPARLGWTCTHCGRCCMDVEGWDRRVLLLEKDINRLEEAGKTGFSEEAHDGRFVAVMKKDDGKCVFLDENGCTVYEDRALLCRMYPFYVEQQGDIYLIGVDNACPGIGRGKRLTEEYYQDLLEYALSQMDE